MTALSLPKFLSMPPARITGGMVELDGQDLLRLPESRLRELRGTAMSDMLQEPMTSLNPSIEIGIQI